MARKVTEEHKYDLDLSTSEEVLTKLNLRKGKEEEVEVFDTSIKIKNTPSICCLRKERVQFRFIPKNYCKVTDPKHVFYGGMSDATKRTFVVPRTSSGSLVEVLTQNEQDYLEEVMGLEKGTLSSKRRVNNFWEEGSIIGISKVSLSKSANYFDLSIPEDYIRYKILLANTDTIASSLKTMEDFPKSTYQFVCVSETEQEKSESANMNSTMRGYMEYGKISEDIDKLRFIVETIEGRPVAPTSKLPFLQNKINSIIQGNPKTFLNVVLDDMLDTKVLIKKAVQAGIITMKGTFLYLREGNIPLCGNDAEPTLNVASAFLNLPKNQELLLTIQAKLNK